ncbi:hypothetical protein TRIUR3_03713 [Triticum urartu]|uniref:Uncharacterized protein n=1 Tax=Triticum urartu TaxID=4572 RepID=M7YSY8_TRIUA|nr:hypothetical protein TRIUR3_03713 [Triticum urartu]
MAAARDVAALHGGGGHVSATSLSLRLKKAMTVYMTLRRTWEESALPRPDSIRRESIAYVQMTLGSTSRRVIAASPNVMRSVWRPNTGMARPPRGVRVEDQMYLVKDIGGAIGLMAAALVLLGTWPVVLAVLERRGRLPQHTYLDYSITNFLAAVLIALTFGQIGGDTPETPNFLTQLTRPQGGVVISLGTVATQYGWAYVGLSVTEVMASSLKVVIEEPKDCEEAKPALPNNKAVEKAEAGTADFLIDLEDKRSIKVLGSNTLVGLAIVTFAGVCYSLFAPAFNLATNDQWHTLSSRRTYTLLGSMLFMFVVAMAVLMASSAHRKPL